MNNNFIDSLIEKVFNINTATPISIDGIHWAYQLSVAEIEQIVKDTARAVCNEIKEYSKPDIMTSANTTGEMVAKIDNILKQLVTKQGENVNET